MPQDLKIALKSAASMADAPGAVALVGTPTETLFFEAVGFAQTASEPVPARKNTIYDLASLTKVIATATAVMQLRDAGKLSLSQPVNELVPLKAFSGFTVHQLLTHTAGLPATIAFFPTVASLTTAMDVIAATPPVVPPNTRRVYSDVGYILLSKMVELVAAMPFEDYCQTHIFDKLGMKRTRFLPPKEWLPEIAPTEITTIRGTIHGSVHDNNAFALGGVAGHAGLFASAEDIGLFCRAMLKGTLLPSKTVEEMTNPAQVPFFPWQGIGFRLDPWNDSAEGFLPSRRAFGHTGWTGTSMWIDPEKQLFYVLLSNTCHPTSAARDNRTLRRGFSLAVADNFYARTSNTHAGIERARWDDVERLKLKKLGLLTNIAATDAQGRRVIDLILNDRRLGVTRLFSPEHGLSGQAAAGEQVGSQRAEVPVVSLYGEKKAPAPGDLEGVDLFVIDLPDVGARYYTYAATMKACLIACASAKVPVLVLDRPNPLGGLILEGPIAESTDSLVCWGRVPIRHGMTLGEIAFFFKNTEPWGANLALDLMPVDQWPRELQFAEQQRPWSAPSPNLPTAESALAYIGTCLFEGINFNEGRGTDAPFLQFGAPWLDPAHLIAHVKKKHEGCELQETVYTPRAIPGVAPHPAYEGKACHGVRITITDPEKFRPFSLAVDIIQATRKRHKKELEFKSNFDVLAGGSWLREQLEKGAGSEEINAGIAPALAAFDAARPKFYQTRQQMLQEALTPLPV